jgi:hypothetical protein
VAKSVDGEGDKVIAVALVPLFASRRAAAAPAAGALLCHRCALEGTRTWVDDRKVAYFEAVIEEEGDVAGGLHPFRRWWVCWGIERGMVLGVHDACWGEQHTSLRGRVVPGGQPWQGLVGKRWHPAGPGDCAPFGGRSRELWCGPHRVAHLCSCPGLPGTFTVVGIRLESCEMGLLL